MNECNSGPSRLQCLKPWKRQPRWKGNACHWFRARRELTAFRIARPFRGHLCRDATRGTEPWVALQGHEGPWRDPALSVQDFALFWMFFLALNSGESVLAHEALSLVLLPVRRVCRVVVGCAPSVASWWRRSSPRSHRRIGSSISASSVETLQARVKQPRRSGDTLHPTDHSESLFPRG